MCIKDVVTLAFILPGKTICENVRYVYSQDLIGNLAFTHEKSKN